MAKTVIKTTPTKAVVKVIDANETISLSTDLLFAGQSVQGTPKVYITGIKYSNVGASVITITRNATKICSLGYSGTMNFETYSLTEYATSDIVITCPANSTVILELSKTDGYSDVIQNVGA